ncbi:unnamed protein product [Thlaspi arvense]|uniref:Glycine-rich protein n=1 Tax=Thlaspi arvense TaxID=13288 RepID=A0AAU9RU52_THLAR|nr:unnamed protein product [Thlaspi arvense]
MDHQADFLSSKAERTRPFCSLFSLISSSRFCKLNFLLINFDFLILQIHAASLSALAICLLLLGSSCFVATARPLNDAERGSSINEAIESIFEGFYIGAIKTGGPTPRGKGHGLIPGQALGGIKSSGGPSPRGEGHAFANNAQALGGIKNSGPSPGGDGHEFANARIFGGIKDSGPSSGGDGHRFANAQTLGVSKTLVQAPEEMDMNLPMLRFLEE